MITKSLSKQQTISESNWEYEFDELILDICENDLSEDWLMDRSVDKLESFIKQEKQKSFEEGRKKGIKETEKWINEICDDTNKKLQSLLK